MSTPLQTTLLLSLLAGLPMVGYAQTCQTTSIPVHTPTSQFTDHANGTVTDNKTGLMWKKCSEGQSGNDCSSGSAASYTWQAALAQAQTVNTSGGFATYTDWRVPTINELESIVETQCYDPAINLAVFPNAPYAWFWSSSPVAADGYYAWGVAFSIGNNDWNYKGNGNYGSVRLVRGGQ